MPNARWRMANGKCQMANGKCQMAEFNSELRSESIPHFAFGICGGLGSREDPYRKIDAMYVTTSDRVKRHGRPESPPSNSR
jgi:hypothetical protein